MKTFLLRVCLFLSLLFLIEKTIKLAFPYHWGNVWYSTKFRYLEKHNEHNLLFIGSSQTYRQIDPFVIDSVLNMAGVHSKSFNLGSPGTFSPETYFLFENLLKDPVLLSKIKCVVLELTFLDMIRDNELHQERVNYWITTEYLQFIFKCVGEEHAISSSTKEKYYHQYSISYLENVLNLGQFSDAIMQENYYDQRYIGKQKNGYYPIQIDLVETPDEGIRNNFLYRRKIFMKDTLILATRAEASRIATSNKDLQANSIHLKKIKQLLEISRRNNVKLIFLLPLSTLEEQTISLFNKIEKSNKIAVIDPEEYPQFYLAKNYYDRGHLNLQGAKLYSECIANELIAVGIQP